MLVEDMEHALSMCGEQQKRAESNEKVRLIEEKDDPDYMLLLEKLKEHDKAYRIEYEEEDGSRAVIPYEGALSSDTECAPAEEEDAKSSALKGDSSLDRNSGQQYRKKLRSATKQNDEHFNLARTNRRSKKEEDEDMIQLDPDYELFSQSLKPVDDHYVFMNGGIEIVYDMRSGERMKVEHDDDDHDDESCSDLEIIDSAAFYKTSNSRNRDATGQSEFRRKVIAALEKPFDKEEYKKLSQDIKLHKPKERHLDLRCGRERQIGTQEDGKSYLDYYPGLSRKLLEAQGDWPKCLNLLRGFFLWIKQPEAFCPWLDEECLAVCPRSS